MRSVACAPEHLCAHEGVPPRGVSPWSLEHDPACRFVHGPRTTHAPLTWPLLMVLSMAPRMDVHMLACICVWPLARLDKWISVQPHVLNDLTSPRAWFRRVACMGLPASPCMPTPLYVGSRMAFLTQA